MDNKYIVFKGDTAKYQITVVHVDFNQERDNYYVELFYGMRGGKLAIRKEDMTKDEDGRVFLMFNTSDMTGAVKAVCHYDVPDSDIAGGIRHEVDMQWLCQVVERPNPMVCNGIKYCTPLQEDGREHVVYERVFRGDVNTAYMDLTAQGVPLRDNEGEQLRVHKTESELY